MADRAGSGRHRREAALQGAKKDRLQQRSRSTAAVGVVSDSSAVRPRESAMIFQHHFRFGSSSKVAATIAATPVFMVGSGTGANLLEWSDGSGTPVRALSAT